MLDSINCMLGYYTLLSELWIGITAVGFLSDVRRFVIQLIIRFENPIQIWLFRIFKLDFDQIWIGINPYIIGYDIFIPYLHNFLFATLFFSLVNARVKTFSMSNTFSYQTFQCFKIRRCRKKRMRSHFRGKWMDGSSAPGRKGKRKDREGDW